MNKIIPTMLLAGLSLSGLFVPSVSLATTPGIDLLKEITLKSFLQKANDPKALLHKKLVELNQVDGKNSNGLFPKILTAKNIQIVTIDGQDQFGSYCSVIQGNPGQSKCSNGISETYLILIPSRMSVHKAVVYRNFLFTVKASKDVEWKMDEKGKQYDRKELIKIGDPMEISIEKLVNDSISK